MKDFTRILVGIIFLTLFSGCRVVQPHPSPMLTRNLDPAEVTLAESAASVSHSLLTMAEIERANTPNERRFANPEPYQIGGRVSIDWSGPIEPLMQKVAELSHYRFRVLGVRPAIPPIISMNVKDAPLSDVIRDADFQAGHQASVRVYTSPYYRVIELRYPASMADASAVGPSGRPWSRFPSTRKDLNFDANEIQARLKDQ